MQLGDDAPSSARQGGAVFIAGLGPIGTPDHRVVWSASFQFGGGVENSPEFDSPGGAVAWGRARADKVYISLDDLSGTRLWAGRGAPLAAWTCSTLRDRIGPAG
jgi:hypothetical protein